VAIAGGQPGPEPDSIAPLPPGDRLRAGPRHPKATINRGVRRTRALISDGTAKPPGAGKAPGAVGSAHRSTRKWSTIWRGGVSVSSPWRKPAMPSDPAATTEYQARGPAAQGKVRMDYPSLSLSGDKVAVQVNLFTIGSNAFAGSTVYVVDKAAPTALGASIVPRVLRADQPGFQRQQVSPWRLQLDPGDPGQRPQLLGCARICLSATGHLGHMRRPCHDGRRSDQVW
jgi:hypothetical protein